MEVVFWLAAFLVVYVYVAYPVLLGLWARLAPRPVCTGDTTPAVSIIIAARNEADRIGATVRALRGAFPAARIWVADDASEDGTAEAAMAAGAEVVSRGKPHGKGGEHAAHHVALHGEP